MLCDLCIMEICNLEMICVGIVVIEGLKELLLVCDEKGKLGKYFMGFKIDIVKFE